MHASGSVHGTPALANAFSFPLSCYTGSPRLRPPVCTGMNVSMNAWLPKSVILLRDYDRHKFVSDLLAGITVGLVALPLAMAFAIASGVSPQAGIYCAIVTGFIISALGGSKTQIGGPTGAFVVVVSGIIVTFGATAAVTLLHLPVETIGTRFGGIPSGLPTLAMPNLHYDVFRQLLSPAFTVAMLGAIESLMSAVVSDRMSKDKHNPNVELMAQGVANIISPLFGGLPATGAIARTATNVRAGAKTPVAGMIHALTLLAIVLFAAPLVKDVPLAALAAILMIVAYNMGEWREIPEILKLTAADITVWLLTVTLTVVTDLTFAVEVGMVLAALMFIRKVSRTTTVSPVTTDYVEDSRVHVLQGKDIPDYAIVYRIHGPFLFGATDKFADILNSLDELPPIVILRLRNMTAIDATGLGAIRDLADPV